jgi:RhoGAP domain
MLKIGKKDKEKGSNGKEEKKNKVFGAVLDRNCTTIPHILETCVVYLDSTGLDFEGVFRKSGSLAQMNEYKAKFDNGTDKSITRCTTIST